jgi:phosphoribosylaminoimidazolecarboxamide formyltransferase/IMP cyclohydrolase
MNKYALLSVSDRRNIEKLALALNELGYAILATKGTSTYLDSMGINNIEIARLTRFPEILNGRVKTLHPRIFAGILADRENLEHMRTLEELGIDCIDLVAVNLYPFAETWSREGATHSEIIENIDIGGPSLIRASAKNYNSVIVLTDPEDYDSVIHHLLDKKEVPLDLRIHLAHKAFEYVSYYDSIIAEYFKSLDSLKENSQTLPSYYNVSCRLEQTLRYGENPHQMAGFYLSNKSQLEVLSGRELSFNNHQDIDSTLRGLRLFKQPAVIITKHCNPCGIGVDSELALAYEKAFNTDTDSPYGGIVGMNRSLDLKTAEFINQVFTEIIIAPDYEAGVLEFLKKKKNRRVIKYNPELLNNYPEPWEMKCLTYGWLLQSWDLVQENPAEWKVVSKRQAEKDEWEALIFAWKVVSLLRSNAIAITGKDQVYGLGSGQTSRIDSTHIALWKAQRYGHNLKGAVCASDGFFPFRDSVDELHKYGIKAIIEPGGSKSDNEVIEACNEYGITLVFSGFRHFRH